jgi:MFS family permease
MRKTSAIGVQPQFKKNGRLTSFLEIYRPGVKVGRYLSVLALFGIAFGLYRGVQDNYLAEIVQITAFERGIVEFFREIPGLLVIFFLAALHRFSDSKIFKIGIWCMAAGLAGLLAAGTGKFIVVAFMVAFSVGEHIIMPVRSTISLDLAKQNQGGASLGITTAISNLGNILGYVIAAALFFAFTRMGFGRLSLVRFKSVFLLAVLLMAGAAVTAMALKETAGKTKRRRFYFAGKFFKFYMLEVFYGARKQIFITFAPYVLILHYGADASIISILLGICAVFGFLLSPFMGRLIDTVGYKVIMVGDTLILIVVCLLYGFAHRLFPVHIAFIVVCVNFTLDSVISLASMASNVYVQTIAANQEEITATLSTGVSINHVISIFIALTGGWLWKTFGIEALFSMSAALGIINSLYAASIKAEKPAGVDKK